MPLHHRTASLSGLALFWIASGVAAETVYVDRNNPNCPGSGTESDPFCQIQDGLNAAADGDTVLVSSGTYRETGLDFRGRVIHLVSRDGASTSVIDAELSSAAAVGFLSGEGPGSILEGFTITRAYVAVGCTDSSPTLRKNIISGNGVCACTDIGPAAAAISLLRSSATISGNLIAWNATRAIAFEDSRPQIWGNRIEGNGVPSCDPSGGGGIYFAHSQPVIVNNVLRFNFAPGYDGDSCGGGGFAPVPGLGGAICCFDSSPLIAGNLMVENSATHGAGLYLGFGTRAVLSLNTLTRNSAQGTGGALFCEAGTNVVLSSSVLWSDSASLDPEIHDLSGVLVATDCDVQGGWPGGGNIDLDPIFVDADGEDYRLQISSPCIDAGDATLRTCDQDLAGVPRVLDGRLSGSQRVDIGALEFGNMEVEVSGDLRPGGYLVVDVSGTSGLPAWMFVGATPGQLCSRYGALYIDLSTPWILLPWGTIPSKVQIPIPPSIPTPVQFLMQGLALGASSGGNTSNLATVIVQ